LSRVDSLPALPEGFRFHAVTSDDPRVVALHRAFSLEMQSLYGGDGPSRLRTDDHQEPSGGFVLVTEGDEPVACGGFRPLVRRGEWGEEDDSRAELKGVYLEPSRRGRGLGRALLGELERRIVAAGYEEAWLETGTEQPAAIGLYERADYLPILPYGEFRHDPRSVCFRRRLVGLAPDVDLEALEAIEPDALEDGLVDVRRRCHEAVTEIAAGIASGMTETEGRQHAADVLRNRGLRKGWHKIVVRFGENTTRSFHQASKPDVVLGENDIFFVDVGPIFNGCEGDVGATFTVGHDPEMLQARQDVVELWRRTRQAWLAGSLTGIALYEFAQRQATAMGWVLNLDLTGHRISEFPHASHYDGSLDIVPLTPNDRRWILEIQIRHRSRPFGAFYEDLLLADEELQNDAPALGSARR
jgi:ribosomal protein S18 acetylase RimI-like enzyme